MAARSSQQPERTAAAPSRNGGGRYAAALDCLRAERDTLNELIQKLESIN